MCPVFDGTTYFTNILDPAAQQITFNPNNAATFPPNYDVMLAPAISLISVDTWKGRLASSRPFARAGHRAQGEISFRTARNTPR